MHNNVSCINNCTGCGLCAHICPKSAIEIKDCDSRNHFLYPIIDNNKCVECGLCLKACPSSKKGKALNNDDVYLFEDEDEDRLIKSSSGGAFQIIAQEILKNEKSSVYGAAWNGLKVAHIRITRNEELNKLLGSKYIQSFISKDIYKNVKDDLLNGFRVLFCGTPCQVAAVDTYISDDIKKNLLLVQILCHGVPNQWGFDKCIEHENTLINGQIEKFEFRHKTSVNSDNRKFVYDYIKENKKYQTVGDYFFFPYYRVFHTYSIYRDSCYRCDYRKNRFGDLIIGDFWGISRFNKEYKNDYGKSLIIPLNIKGEKIISLIEAKYICKLDEISKYNESILNDVQPKSEFLNFYQNISNIDFYKSYRINPKKEKIKVGSKNFIKRVINVFLPKGKRKNLTKITYSVKCVK